MKIKPEVQMHEEPGRTPRLALSIIETAEALSLGRTYIYKLIKDGQLRVVRVGGRTLVPMASIEELLAPKQPGV